MSSGKEAIEFAIEPDNPVCDSPLILLKNSITLDRSVVRYLTDIRGSKEQLWYCKSLVSHPDYVFLIGKDLISTFDSPFTAF